MGSKRISELPLKNTPDNADFIPLVDTQNGVNNYTSRKTTVGGLLSGVSAAASAAISAQKGQAGGLATLGNDGKVPSSQLPADVDSATNIITSVNGKTGAVVLSAADVNAILVAPNWTSNHTIAAGTRYLVNDVVYAGGNIYRALYENESEPVTNDTYWQNIGAGSRLNIDGRDIPNIPYPVTSVNGQTGAVTIESGPTGPAGPQGIPGPQGEPGPAGSGVSIKGTLSVWPPAAAPNVGDMWIAGTNIPTNSPQGLAAGDGVVWTGTAWENVGPIRGPQGATGPQGPAGDPATNIITSVNGKTGAVVLSADDITTGTFSDQLLSNNIARTADIDAALADLVSAAPESLATLNQLSAALGNDPNFATTITNSIAAKAPINNPTFTGTVSGITKTMVGLGAVPNVDATLRSNHTGTQLASTISDFNNAVAEIFSDAVDTSMVAGTNVVLTYTSTNNTLTIGLATTLSGLTIDGGTP